MERFNITLLYDSCEFENTTSFPRTNGHAAEPSRLLKDLNAVNVKVNYQDLNSFFPTDKTIGIYPIELFKIHFNKIFDNISAENIKLIKKLKIPILLYFPTEGFDYYNNYWLDYIHAQFIKYNITNNSVYLIFGDLKIEKGYIEYFNDSEELLNTYKFKKVFPMSYFEWSLENYLKYRWSKEHLRKEEYVTEFELINHKRKHNFLSYNGNFRPHRIAMVTELLRNNLCNDSLISFSGGCSPTLNECIPKVEKLLSFDGRQYLQKFIVDWKPIILDYNQTVRMNYVNQIQKHHFLNTFYSIIAETEYSSKSIFLTEKTFKAIKSLHPFLIYGNPGTLKMLKELGYETFPEMFCEDYDKEEDHKLRLSMIISEVKKFNSLSTKEKVNKFESVREKLLHNRANLETRASNMKLQFKDIFNTIIEIEKNVKDN